MPGPADANGVDVATFQLALPSLAPIGRQINAAQKQLLAFLKKIDRRDTKRAEALRRAAYAAVARGRSTAAAKREAD